MNATETPPPPRVVYEDGVVRIRPMGPQAAQAAEGAKATQDAEGLFAAVKASHVELGRFLPFGRADYRLEEAIEWVEAQPRAWKAGTDFTFALELCSEPGLIGGVGVHCPGKEKDHWGSLGYWMRSDFSGRGHCTRGARLAARFAFEQLGFKRLEILAMTHNAGSRRVCEKLGASFEGVLRARIGLNAEVYDAACYSLLPGELAAPEDDLKRAP